MKIMKYTRHALAIVGMCAAYTHTAEVGTTPEAAAGVATQQAEQKTKMAVSQEATQGLLEFIKKGTGGFVTQEIDINLLRAFIAQGADLKTKIGDYQYTVLHWGLKNRIYDVELYQELVKAGVSPWARDAKNRTARDFLNEINLPDARHRAETDVLAHLSHAEQMMVLAPEIRWPEHLEKLKAIDCFLQKAEKAAAASKQ